MGASRRKPAFAFLSHEKTIVYIDGFNLYYRLKNTSYKWLNLQRLSEFYLPPKQNKIIEIKYFTALVKRNSNNNSNIIKQNIYLRAIRTIPSLSVILGQFKKRHMTGMCCRYENGRYIEGNELITISKWEEKESDVNIATHMVADTSKYDCAILISNDTDLKTPLRYIKENFKKRVGIISPRRDIHMELKEASHFQKESLIKF